MYTLVWLKKKYDAGHSHYECAQGGGGFMRNKT